MNKLKKILFAHGTYLGEGSSRVAFEWKGKVYKIPYRASGKLQAQNEKFYYEQLKDMFGYLFPNPSFLANGIVCLDKVDILTDIYGDRDDVVNLLQQLVEENTISKEQVWDFENFLEYVREETLIAIGDLDGNSDNVGIRNNEIKIVDWGYSSNVINFHEYNPHCYGTLQKNISRYGRSFED